MQFGAFRFRGPGIERSVSKNVGVEEIQLQILVLVVVGIQLHVQSTVEQRCLDTALYAFDCFWLEGDVAERIRVEVAVDRTVVESAGFEPLLVGRK